MTNLTEKFNNDEIDESKLYYFKQKMSEEIEIGHPFSLNMVRAIDDTYLDWFLIDKVLAPVPSYNEWEKLNWYAGNGVEENQELKMENTKLKENIHSMLFTDDVVQDRYDKVKKENEHLKEQLAIAVEALKTIEQKSDKFDDSWGIQEQLDFIKAEAQSRLYQIEELEK